MENYEGGRFTDTPTWELYGLTKTEYYEMKEYNQKGMAMADEIAIEEEGFQLEVVDVK
jgi:hypothetical protein